MRGDHWFDTLNKVVVRDTPRRAVLRAAVAAIAGCGFSDPLTEAARNKKRKGKGKGNGKKRKKKCKPNPNRGSSCSGGACAAQWAGDAAQIAHCEFICRQCDGGDPREFCIVEIDPANQTKAAFCCAENARCCGATCCDLTFAGLQCCDGECVNTDTREDHCGACNQVCSGDGMQCCGGECADTMANLDHCGGCGQPCDQPGAWSCCDGDCTNIGDDEENCGGCGRTCIGPGLRCCDGACVNTLTDAEHCGECNNACPPGEVCVDGGCDCGPGQSRCFGACRETLQDPNNCGGCNLGCNDPHRPDCCDGRCVNTQFVPSHCGACGHRCQINETCFRGECRCVEGCCNSNSSGVCVGPTWCCPEPCSVCKIGECVRWRGGTVGGYCEEHANFCDVVSDYCPVPYGGDGVHEGSYDCCGPRETCAATGCVRAP